MHLSGTFYGTLIFQQSSMTVPGSIQWTRLSRSLEQAIFVLAAMLEDILLPSNVAAKTTFCLYLVKRLIVTMYAQLC